MIEVEIHPVGPERIEDYLQFFDDVAFPPGHRWASCYCYAYNSECNDKEWAARSGLENRESSRDLICSGHMHGLLAYVSGKPVAWCHAGPRRLVRNFQAIPEFANDPDADRIGAIVCFVVPAAYRRHGLARRLLDAACEGFRRQGLTIAEAYPPKDATVASASPRIGSDEANYKGPASMFRAAGFVPMMERDGLTIVRKSLTWSA